MRLRESRSGNKSLNNIELSTRLGEKFSNIVILIRGRKKNGKSGTTENE